MMEKEQKASKAKGCLGILAFILLVLIIFIIIGVCSRSDREKTEDIKIENKVIPIKDRLRTELDSFIKAKPSNEYENIEALTTSLIMFNAYARMIKEADTIRDPETKKLVSELKQKISAHQISELPKMRKAYIKVMANTMWEHDVYIDIEGKRNTIINIRSSVFVTNKNVKTIQEIIQNVVYNLRFEKVRYRWYKGQDEFPVYSIKPEKDSELYLKLLPMS